MIERFENYSFKVKNSEYLIEFTVKNNVEETLMGGVWVYQGDHQDQTDFDKASDFLEGSIKSDGCSNWHFASCVHFCDRKETASVSRLLDHLYGIASERLPTFDDS